MQRTLSGIYNLLKTNFHVRNQFMSKDFLLISQKKKPQLTIQLLIFDVYFLTYFYKKPQGMIHRFHSGHIVFP